MDNCKKSKQKLQIWSGAENLIQCRIDTLELAVKISDITSEVFGQEKWLN